MSNFICPHCKYEDKIAYDYFLSIAQEKGTIRILRYCPECKETWEGFIVVEAA